jgi:hypothetical protein
MMLLLRRILRGGTRRTLLCSLVLLAVAVLVLGPAQPARACWRTELIECFDRLPTAWPWSTQANPPRAWSVGGNAQWTWGINDRVYNASAPGCSANEQAAWCIGYPDQGQDPDYNVYGANWNTYMVWGPINLATAVDAQCSFWLYSRCGIGDSVYWGACQTSNPNTNPRIGGSRLLRTTDWEMQLMNLTNMRNANGDSVSMLGYSTVYLFWRLKADAGETPLADHDMGPFVDNVTVAWDDGQRNMKTTAPVFYTISGSTSEVLTQARMGDQIYAAFNVSTCSGGLGRYPAFNVRAWLNDTLKVYDSTYTGINASTTLQCVTLPWQIVVPDTHCLKIFVDSANVVVENSETDNRSSGCFGVLPPNPPPRFQWLMAEAETLTVTETSLLLHWEASDTLEVAHTTLYYDTDELGCTATPIIGGSNRSEHDGPDSLFWNIQLLPLNTPYYLLARINDADTSICVHSAFPFVKRSLAVDGDHSLGGAIPERFYLAQNYPNPFNPQTELRFGLAKAGHVTLRVFDITGREVATLLDGERAPGSYSVSFNGSHLASGLYFYTISTPEGTDSRKMMLMK